MGNIIKPFGINPSLAAMGFSRGKTSLGFSRGQAGKTSLAIELCHKHVTHTSQPYPAPELNFLSKGNI